ncbi:MAG TPA: cation transporter [Candidatus Dormibacteraeota bacterium]|nr:cation transporter [Candidatus Dormibacteraeota bacterium]
METAAPREAAIRLGVRLEVVTVVWMVAEAVLAIGAGLAARSVLLTAFGVDSVVEVLSGLVLLRRLKFEGTGRSHEGIEGMERTTARISGVLLIILCVYVVVTSVVGLLVGLKPEGSALGIAVAAAALVVMPLLALAKSRANRQIGSASLRADVAETITCAYLAAVTLAGIGLSSLLGLWWLQYLAALALLIWLIPETREALEAAAGGHHEHDH